MPIRNAKFILTFDFMKHFSVAEEQDYFYLDDFVNHPDIINHPALEILARRDGQLKNVIARQGFTPRQALGGILAATSSPFGVSLLNAKLFEH